MCPIGAFSGVVTGSFVQASTIVSLRDGLSVFCKSTDFTFDLARSIYDFRAGSYLAVYKLIG